MASVTCPVSNVKCNMSHVMYHISMSMYLKNIYIMILKKLQSGRAISLRVCYQCGFLSYLSAIAHVHRFITNVFHNLWPCIINYCVIFIRRSCTNIWFRMNHFPQNCISLQICCTSELFLSYLP